MTFAPITRLTVPLAASALLLAAMPAFAQDDAARSGDAAKLRQQVMRCFTPSNSDSGTARVAFELGPDGALAKGPDIVSSSGSQRIASAGKRAVIRCAPYSAGIEGKVEVVFRFDGSSERNAERPAEPERDRQTAGATVSGAPLEGAPVPYTAPEGLCFVDPVRSKNESIFWNAYQAPPGRAEILETLAVDCSSLARIVEGERRQPVEVAMVARTEEPPGVSETREKFLQRLGDRLEADEPLEPRFWQAPPIEGNPLVARDAEAVYTAKRNLAQDGKVSLTVISGYTRIDGVTRTFALARSDGTDIGPTSYKRVAKWIRTAREQSRSGR